MSGLTKMYQSTFFTHVIILLLTCNVFAGGAPIHPASDVIGPMLAEEKISDYQGSSAPYFVMEENGPADKRIKLVYISEGYRAAELGTTWPGHADINWDYRQDPLTRPFPRYRKYFNVYRIDLASEQSGIDLPDEGVVVNTALDGTGRGRLGTVNRTKAWAEANSALEPLGIEPDWLNAVLNTEEYYNSGGGVCVYAHPYAREIGMHEGGHSFHDLADEYTYGSGGTYSGGEFREINVSNGNQNSKWSHWVGYNQPDMGVMGSYLGGRYYSSGVWRPSQDSKMKDTHDGRPFHFNMISIEKIIQDIYEIIEVPIDSQLSTAATLLNPASIWVKLIDPDVVKVDWYVNDELVVEQGGESFNIGAHGYGAGTYTVRAEIYDEVVKHANSPNANPHELDMVRTGLDALQWQREWTVELDGSVNVIPGAITGNFQVLNTGGGLLTFHSPVNGQVKLEIVDVKGRVTWQSDVYARQGNNSVSLKARSANPGVYLLKIHTGKRVLVNKLLFR